MLEHANPHGSFLPLHPLPHPPGGEPTRGGDNVAVVGYELWTRFLGSEQTLEDLRIDVDVDSYAVVGVMPPGFKVLEDTDGVPPFGARSHDGPELQQLPWRRAVGGRCDCDPGSDGAGWDRRTDPAGLS